MIERLMTILRSLLHQHLSNPPTPSPHHRASIASTISPPLPSPTLQGTSPKGSRLTFASFSKSQTPPIPSIPDLHQPQPPSPNVMGRRKSSFGLNLRNKDKEDNTKLPKEFLIEFWGTLDAEQGDEGWRMAVRDFLGGIKKGSKTAGGSNLREVTSLLDGEFEYGFLFERQKDVIRPGAGVGPEEGGLGGWRSGDMSWTDSWLIPRIIHQLPCGCPQR